MSESKGGSRAILIALNLLESLIHSFKGSVMVHGMFYHDLFKLSLLMSICFVFFFAFENRL